MRRPGKALVAGLAIVLVFAVLALVSAFWTPMDPESMDIASRLQGPSAAHPFGTDHFGRDTLSRVMEATRTALLTALVSVSLGAIGGVLLGTLASLAPRWVGALVSRIIDAMMAFPTILMAMGFSFAFGKGLLPSMAAVCFAMVPSFGRTAKTMVDEERTSLQVKAARSLALPEWRVALFHILPEAASRLVTQYTSSIGSAILLESSLSFLGLGIQPPSSSLGMMLSEARAYALTWPGQAMAPGLCLVLLTLGFNLLGDGVNDMLGGENGR